MRKDDYDLAPRQRLPAGGPARIAMRDKINAWVDAVGQARHSLPTDDSPLAEPLEADAREAVWTQQAIQDRLDDWGLAGQLEPSDGTTIGDANQCICRFYLAPPRFYNAGGRQIDQRHMEELQEESRRRFPRIG